MRVVLSFSASRASVWLAKQGLLMWGGGVAAAAAPKSLQSCPTLCDPIDGSLLGSSVPGILQARTLEWVAISLSRGVTRQVISPLPDQEGPTRAVRNG